jgi:carbon catabolite-derepressing protein kinase
MLLVDPVRRISIGEIRKNKWFNISLPDYLKPLPDNDPDPFGVIDDAIVDELQQVLDINTPSNQ